MASGALVAATLSSVPAAQAAQPTVRMVMDINPGAAGIGFPNSFAELSPLVADVDGTVFFAATDGVHGTELWKSDGTEAGTQLVKDAEDPGSSNFATLVGTGDKVFLRANGADELWVSDGTEEGTFEIWRGFDGGPYEPHHLTPAGARLFFSASTRAGDQGRELWVTDGTRAGTRMVADLVAGTGDGIGSFQGDDDRFAVLGDRVLFNAPADGGRQLWISDGTLAGTSVVARDETLAGNGQLDPEWLLAVGDSVYFRGAGPGGDTLYVSDGTEAGTEALAPPGTEPEQLVEHAGDVYFSGRDSDEGRELWVSDGTPEGTTRVSQISTGDSLPQRLTSVGDTLYFTAVATPGERDLWKFDTEASLVKDVEWGPARFENDTPRELTAVGDTLFFRGKRAADDGSQLWSSDGTATGTRPVTINPAGGGAAYDLTASDGRLFFTADDGEHGRELWMAEPPVPGQLADNGVLDAGVTAKKRQRGLKPKVVADCAVGCTVEPRGRYVIQVKRGKTVTVRAKGISAEGGPGKVVGKLKPKGKKATKKVRNALASGKVVKAKLAVVVTEVEGSDNDTVKMTVRLVP